VEFVAANIIGILAFTIAAAVCTAYMWWPWRDKDE